ncbi:MAG: type IV secretion protein DotH [Rhodospirillales bacterium]|nr:type IV secretion protein DotH [Rhodospirillales bacterium]
MKHIPLIFAVLIGALLVYAAPAAAQSPELLSPSGEGDTALPSPGNASPRAPGMLLSPDDSFGGNVRTSAVESQEEVEAEIKEQSFNAAITGLLPMEPYMIRDLLKRYDKTQEALQVPIYPYPQPEISVETISLDPGSSPPLIKVAVEHVTTLNILDITGAPWPIQDIGWAGKFEIIQPEDGAHVIRITPMEEYAHGNISIRLLGLKTPIVFTLETHRDVVQYRLDARVPEFGPQAKAPLIEGGLTIAAGDSILGTILDGVPPEGAIRLDISGIDGRTSAYLYNDQTYVRTPLSLLSPGWDKSVSSADGMNVYALANAPVLLLSDKGRVVRAVLSNKEDTPDE